MLHKNCFLFFFWLHCTAFGILVPWPGIEPKPPEVEAWGLNHCTAREVPIKTFFHWNIKLVKFVGICFWAYTHQSQHRAPNCFLPYMAQLREEPFWTQEHFPISLTFWRNSFQKRCLDHKDLSGESMDVVEINSLIRQTLSTHFFFFQLNHSCSTMLC